MLKIYKVLEDQITSDKTTPAEKVKCAEMAANIAIDVLKMESEGIKAVKELVAKNVQGKNILDNLHHQSRQSKNRCDNDESDNIQPEYDPNRKF